MQTVHVHTRLAEALAASAAFEAYLLCHVHPMHCCTVLNEWEVKVVPVVGHHDARLDLYSNEGSCKLTGPIGNLTCLAVCRKGQLASQHMT